MPTKAISRVRGIGTRAQGQDVHADGARLDRLLVRHAEALLLVDDEETEVLERDVLAQETVRADDHVDRSVGQTRAWSLGFDVVDEAAEHGHLHGKSGEALTEGGEVLAREQASSGPATPACLLSWTALKTARIATSVLPKPTSAQTSRSIGTRQFHVGLDVLDRLGLVGREREGEEVLHLALPFGVGLKACPTATVRWR
jgi:hypothetical protein